MSLLNHLFYVNSFSILLLCMVVFIGICVGSFSKRYMKGDSAYKSFSLKMLGLITSVCVTIIANHFVILSIFWGLSTFFLVHLMMYKPQWKAARNSAKMTAKNYLFSFILMTIAFALFYLDTGEITVSGLIHHTVNSLMMRAGLGLLLVSTLMQSALWPFHKWLISSLNSPTPVSAVMHAGVINGGGILFIRLAPLYEQTKGFLLILFVVGIVTAGIGTLWKLIQTDVKRMLACSTMAQMGFMMAQCGLGLFPAAVAHVVWHSFFKAYLFLSSSGAAQEARFDLPPLPTTGVEIGGALLCGLVGSLPFAAITHKSWSAHDSTLILLIVGWVTVTQVALPIIRGHTFRRWPLALGISLAVGTFYGGAVQMIATLMPSVHPQPLSVVHIMGLLILVLGWGGMILFRKGYGANSTPQWMVKGYVYALNASQPHPDTVTAYRNYYTYKAGE